MMPPRTRGESARTIPSNPKRIASTARIPPQNAPVEKLAIAQTIAMIEGMLNLAGTLVWVSMIRILLLNFSFGNGPVYDQRTTVNPCKLLHLFWRSCICRFQPLLSERLCHLHKLGSGSRLLQI